MTMIILICVITFPTIAIVIKDGKKTKSMFLINQTDDKVGLKKDFYKTHTHTDKVRYRFGNM